MKVCTHVLHIPNKNAPTQAEAYTHEYTHMHTSIRTHTHNHAHPDPYIGYCLEWITNQNRYNWEQD